MISRAMGVWSLLAVTWFTGCTGGKKDPDGALADRAALDRPVPERLVSDSGLDLRAVDLELADRRGPDGGVPAFPGCATACGQHEVCHQGLCAMAGPPSTCGSGPYPAGLPSTNLFYVNAAYGGLGDGSPAKPFRTIKEALAAVPAAATDFTVAVAAGAYSDPLTIGRSVQIRCLCPGKVTIAGVKVEASVQPVTVLIDGCRVSPLGPGVEPAAWGTCASPDGFEPRGVAVVGMMAVELLVRNSRIDSWCSGLYFNAPQDSFSNLCLSRSRLDANVRGMDVQLAPLPATSSFPECAGTTQAIAARLSRIDRNRDFGVFTRKGARGAFLEANRIELNGRLGNQAGGLGFGVYLGDVEGVDLLSNVFEKNENRGVGIRNLDNPIGPTIVIDKNVLRGNRGAALALQHLKSAQIVKVTGNLIADTAARDSEPGGDGIQASASAGQSFNVVITGNAIADSTRHGVFLDGTGGLIDGNTMAGNDGYAILLQQSTATVGSNTFSGNTKGDVFTAVKPVDVWGAIPIPIP